MSPDDRRHGTIAGRAAGCRDACCNAAQARYEKRRRFNNHRGTPLAVPALGAQRRIQALACLGWTTGDVAQAAGWTNQRVRQILDGQKGRPCIWLRRDTDQTIRAIYADLATRAPEDNQYRRRARAHAKRLGWAPPQAWRDIDNDRSPDRRASTEPLEAPALIDGRWTQRRGVMVWEVA